MIFENDVGNFNDSIQVEATDNDEGENAEITYSIYHVSNNGLHKFKIDPRTGVIESVRKLNAGEQFSITVQATDKGGKYSQTIVEVNVIPGPNTRSPVFQQPVYEVQVSEGASINSTVATITVSVILFFIDDDRPRCEINWIIFLLKMII